MEPHDPATTPARLPHLPGLDGLRGLALLAVLGFHAGLSWLRGGYLPVTAFFVLSGFLITALLLRERDVEGRIDLRAFWGRRARRLAPALLVTVGLVAVYTVLVADRNASALVGDTIASLTWVTNWRFIVAGTGYADVWGAPSPLQHLWSLSVEEQFYVVLPLLAAGTLALGRGRRRWLAATSVVVAAVSVLVMRGVYRPGEQPIRAYFGTDARAAELLVGVLLATVLLDRNGLREIGGRARHLLDAAGLVALGLSLFLWCRVPQMSPSLFKGGFVAIALLAAVVIAAVSQPRTLTARLLGAPPLAAIGRVSYGAYLFHWPVFLWLSEARTGWDGPTLFVARFATTFLLAVGSYRLVEQPIRLGQIRTRVAQVGWLNAAVALTGVVAVIGGSITAPAMTLRTGPPPPPPTAGADALAASAGTSVAHVPEAPSDTAAVPTTGATPTTGREGRAPQSSRTTGAPVAAPAGGSSTTSSSTTRPPLPPLRVLVVGDSLAQNLGTGLTDWASRTGQAVVYDISQPGCGVLRSGQVRWPDGSQPAPLAQCGLWGIQWPSAVSSFHPDVVVVEVGITELFDRKNPDWPGFLAPGDPTFDAFMVEEYAAAVDALAGVPTVVWANVPCVRWSPGTYPNHFTQSDGEARIGRHGQSILPRLAKARRASVIDLFGAVCPSGQFSSTVAGVGNARPDGAHLTDAAAAALSRTWLGPALVGLAGR